jgi:hypothetical protein
MIGTSLMLFLFSWFLATESKELNDVDNSKTVALLITVIIALCGFGLDAAITYIVK